jgi:hypothetical protein
MSPEFELRAGANLTMIDSYLPGMMSVTRFWILDFGFWILDWLRLERTKLEIRQFFLIIPFEKGGLKPLFFGHQ